MHTIIDGDGLLYQAAYNVKGVKQAYDKLLDKIEQLCTQDWDQTGDFTMFIEGDGNWRRDVFSGYKAHRKTKAQEDPNKQLRKDLSQHLINEKFVIPAVGCESDDLVRRKAEAMRKRGQPYIVASADKDLDMVIGPHVRFNPQWKLQTYDITEEESDYNYFKQIMLGDMQDNIRSPKMLGPKTVEKLLKENHRSSWKQVVEDQYKQRCGKEWKHALYFTGSLVHIQRHQGDMFNWNKEGTWWDLGFQGVPSCYPYTDIQLGESS